MLVGYARVSTQDQKPDLQTDALKKRRVRKDIQGEGLRCAAGPVGAESRLGLHERRGHARGLEARPAGSVFETAHRNHRGYGGQRDRVQIADGKHRHHGIGRQAGLPYLRIARGVRALHHPGTHTGRPGCSQSKRQKRRPAAVPDGKRHSGSQIHAG